MRTILGVIAGLAVSFVVTLLVQMAGHQIFPPPEGLDPTDRESIAAYMDTIPLGALIMVVLAWALGPLAGGIVSVLISRENWTGWVIGGFVLALTAINLIMIPHPLWMIGAGPLAIALATFVAVKLVGAKAA